MLLLGACSSAPVSHSPDAGEPLKVTATPPMPKAAQLSIVAVGDTMLGSDFPADRLPPNDGHDLLASVRDILRNADLSFVNVEGVLMDGGEPEKRCDNPQLCYLFRSPTRYAATLADAGFDVASLANNHARDFGETGRSSSMQALQAAGIATTGREGDIASLDIHGLRIAVIGFAPNVGSWSINDIEGARHVVAGLAIGHDIVIVSFHGGAEGNDAIHVKPGAELFYGENRGDLIAFAHGVIDAGADLVIGHGPHVPRAIELYRERLIAYSLGNFMTHWGISVSDRKGLAPILDVTLTAEGRFTNGRIHSAVQRRPDGVFPDPSQAAYRLIRELTREDFNDGGLRFDNAGNFTPRE